jgi:hypothetical protein
MIPEALIDYAIECCELPSCLPEVTAFSKEVYQAVGDLKASRILKESPKFHWARLQTVLDVAVMLDKWEVFDDFARAWKNVHVAPGYTTDGTSGLIPRDLGPKTGRPKRSPITWLVAKCVQELQWELNRTPSRSEIVAKAIPFQVSQNDGQEILDLSATELSRQLKRLGWEKMIPSKRKM